MTAPTLYFVRHGQTDWNVENRIQGQHDIPINQTGRQQARRNGLALADLLDDPNRYRFIASPLGRTRETMNIIRQQMGLPSQGYETDDRLKEIYFGLWQTYTMAELGETQASAVAAREADKFNFRPPLGESYADLLNRVRSWLPYVVEDSVIVCHGGVLRMLIHHLTEVPGNEVTRMTIPQDRIYRWDGNDGVWL